MNDRLFRGGSVVEAVAAASQALGIAEDRLRYVVLEAGTPARHGYGGTPAQIAVLLPGEADANGLPPISDPRAAEDPIARLRRIVEAFIRAADLAVEMRIDETPQAVRVRFEGPDNGYVAGEGGELLEALEHLLSRMVGPLLHPKRLLFDGVARREQREEELRRLALEIAEQVRADGAPRATPPLNAYERRIIHMVIGEQAGLRSFSTGEGRERRVTVARAEASAPLG